MKLDPESNSWGWRDWTMHRRGHESRLVQPQFVVGPGFFSGGGKVQMTYDKLVLEDAPVAYYRLNETNGTVAANLGSNGIAGTYSGATLDQGALGSTGKSVYFAGTSASKVNTNFNTHFTSLTVEFLFNPAIAGQTVNATLIGKLEYFANTTSAFPFVVRWNRLTQRLYVGLSSGNDFTVDATLDSPMLTAEQDYHVAVVYVANSSLQLWVNGEMVGSTAITFAISNPALNWTIANASAELGGGVGINGFVGRMSEVAFYNKALAPERILRHYLATSLPAQPPVDPHYPKVSLLLHGDGVNNSTAVVDSSIYARTITVFGNARISTGTAFFGGASILLDGTDDYLSTPHDTQLSPGASGSYTIEAVIRPTTVNRQQSIASKRGSFASGLANREWVFSLLDNAKIQFVGFNSAGTVVANCTGVTSIVAGVSTHVAAVRYGTTWYIFVNGVLDATAAETGAIGTEASLPLQIGRDFSTGTTERDFSGNIEELRITKGVARYVADFDVPVQPHPNPPSVVTSLLLQGDGANNGANLADSSVYDRTVQSLAGNPRTSWLVSKYGGSSIYLDGSSRFNYADANELDLPGDFTIECFTQTATGGYILSKGSNGTGPYSYAFGVSSAGKVFGMFSSVTSPTTLNSDYINPVGVTSINDGQVHHIAITRRGSTFRVFVDGKLDFTQVWAPTVFTNTVPLVVGAGVSFSQSSYTGFYTGYVDELRITKGLARYIVDFTPPAAPFVQTVDPQLDPDFAYVKYLSNDGTLADLSSASTTVSNQGTGAAANQGPFGTSAIVFDSSDRVELGSTAKIGAQEFSVQMWVYQTSRPSSKYLWTQYHWSSGDFANRTLLFVTSGGLLSFQKGGSNVAGTTVMPLNAWNFVEVTRVGNIIYLFLNGRQEATMSISGALGDFLPCLGHATAGAAEGTATFQGMMAGIRITIGKPRNIADYKIPSAVFPISS